MGWRWMFFKMVFGKFQSIVVKANPDNSIEFISAKKPVERVKFLRENRFVEKGEDRVFFSEIEKNKHNLKGSSKPVHIVVDGQFKNIGLLETYRQKQDVEEIERIGTMSYQAGIEYAKMDSAGKGFDMNRAAIILFIVVILATLANMAIGWQLLTGEG